MAELFDYKAYIADHPLRLEGIASIDHDFDNGFQIEFDQQALQNAGITLEEFPPSDGRGFSLIYADGTVTTMRYRNDHHTFEVQTQYTDGTITSTDSAIALRLDELLQERINLTINAPDRPQISTFGEGYFMVTIGLDSNRGPVWLSKVDSRQYGEERFSIQGGIGGYNFVIDTVDDGPFDTDHSHGSHTKAPDEHGEIGREMTQLTRGEAATCMKIILDAYGTEIPIEFSEALAEGAKCPPGIAEKLSDDLAGLRL